MTVAPRPQRLLLVIHGIRGMTIWLYPGMRVASEGLVFILPLVGLTAVSAWCGWWSGTIVAFVLTVGVTGFFRDPERVIPTTPGAIVAPADGRVMEIVTAPDHTCRISIFLSPLDVHINRAPYGGTVREVVYTPGKFLAAYRPEASEVNEANCVTIVGQAGAFMVKQIAGVLARRIVCRVRAGDVLVKGQRYGLIRFGSRTDLVLPAEVNLVAQIGDVVRGGETVLAFLKEPQGT